MIISVLFFLLFSIKVNATDACPAFESALIQSTEKVQKKLSQEEIEAAL